MPHADLSSLGCERALWQSGDTALIAAAKNGHAAVARFLIVAGANPNAQRGVRDLPSHPT